MISEGLILQTGIYIGRDIPAAGFVSQFDAVCLTTGCGKPRDLEVEGRDLKGIMFAMDFLSSQNRINSGENSPAPGRITAEGKKVLVIGGGDTGSDCVGTSIRQRAQSVTQIEIMPSPPASRTPGNPWPYFARVLKTSTSHEEGCTRMWGLATLRFTGSEGNVSGAEVEEVEWIQQNGRMVMKTHPRYGKNNRGRPDPAGPWIHPSGSRGTDIRTGTRTRCQKKRKDR
jgi:glutamate synthase (NADPH/NADH) small chain